jgi:signal transduction histidine kinase
VRMQGWSASTRHAVFDAALAGALVVIGLIDLFGSALGGVFPGSHWVHLPFVVFISAPIAWRRRWPLATLIVVAVVESVWVFGLYPIHQPPPLEPFVALLIAVYSAAAYAEGRAARAAWVTVALGVLSDIPSLVAGKPIGNVAGPDVTLLIAFSLGLGFARSRRRAEAQELRAAQAEREAAEAAERAVAEERARIARELHDVISHDVSMMVVQASVERRVMASDPSMTAQTLENIETAGREALAELRRMLGVLRKSGQDSPLAPQPGLGQLPDLIARASEAGVGVRVVLEGEPSELPAGLDLAAYRIVQESLTNIVKHAPHSAAEVTVRYDPDAIDLAIRNDAPSKPGPNLSGAGHGLIGMRERVAVYGGTFESGPCPDGGYHVHARLPLAAP